MRVQLSAPALAGEVARSAEGGLRAIKAAQQPRLLRVTLIYRADAELSAMLCDAAGFLTIAVVIGLTCR